MLKAGKRFGCVLTTALALAIAGPAMAATGHSHEGHSGGAVQLSLNHEKKWQTDEALRRGMLAARANVVEALDRIHGGKYSADEYRVLAQKVEAHVDDVTKNCHLPENADAQLHVVLAEILEGIEGMKKGPERIQAVVKVVRALDAYSTYFDHPGFEPLQH